MSNSITKDTDALLRTLAQVYAMENKVLEVEILAKSKVELEEIEYDNWNGGTYTYALKLQISPVLYTKINKKLEEIENDMLQRISPLLRGYYNEHLNAVIITMELEHKNNWRNNAEKWLAQASKVNANLKNGYDAFICHATEDKAELVRPLAEYLASMGFKIWYDEFELTIGDSLRQSIDKGLSNSRYGIVVLSNSFFAKDWTQYELDGLVAKQGVGYKVVLPIWHKITRKDVLKYSPSLADKLALNSEQKTIQELGKEIGHVLKGSS